MKYLISHQIRVLAGCLDNYKDTWDIIPLIVRYSFRNPGKSLHELIATAQLDRYESLFSRLKNDLKTIEGKDIILKRASPDGDTKKLFTMADVLLKSLAGLKKEKLYKPEGENELLSIVIYLHEGMELIKKKTNNPVFPNDFVETMKFFPFSLQATIREEIKRKKELLEEAQGVSQKEKSRKEELQKELQTGPGSRTAKRECKVYLDMDSCLTNFDKAVKKLGAKAAKGLSDDATEDERQYMYNVIERNRSQFWSGMEWMPKGQELWKVIKPYDPVLLSSPGKFKYAPAGKEDWVNKNLPGIPLFLDEDKYQYAEMDSVLIDDMKSNIISWQEAGGIGILYEGNPEMVKDELKNIMSQPG